MERVTETPRADEQARRNPGRVSTGRRPIPRGWNSGETSVESIRSFDPGNQRSLQQMENVTVAPAEELLPSLADPDEIGRAFTALDFGSRSTKARDRMEEELSLMAAGHYVEEQASTQDSSTAPLSLIFFPVTRWWCWTTAPKSRRTLREFDRRSFELRETKRERGELPGGFPSPYFTREEIRERLERASKTLQLTRWSGWGDFHLSLCTGSLLLEPAAPLRSRRGRTPPPRGTCPGGDSPRSTPPRDNGGEWLGARILEELTEPPAPGSDSYPARFPFRRMADAR